MEAYFVNRYAIQIRKELPLFPEHRDRKSAAAPSPGNSPVNPLAETAEVRYFPEFFNLKLGFVIICLGRLVFWSRLKINPLVPNSPDNKGNNGCCKLRFKVASPNIPARRKITVAFILDFSFKITKRVAVKIIARIEF